MFFKKKKNFLDTELGEIVYESGLWVIRGCDSAVGPIYISFDSKGDLPSDKTLIQIKTEIKNICERVASAEALIRRKDLDELIDKEFQVEFEGLHIYENPEHIDYSFGIPGWDDGGIVVHFNNGIPKEISLLD